MYFSRSVKCKNGLVVKMRSARGCWEERSRLEDASAPVRESNIKRGCKNKFKLKEITLYRVHQKKCNIAICVLFLF